MRPEITGTLEDRVKRIYKEAGYGTASELVRDAVRNHLNDLEAQIQSDDSSARRHFSYRIFTSQGYPPEIRLSPKNDSPIKVERFEKGGPPYTVLLDTGTSYIGADKIEETLEQLDGVDDCSVPHTSGEIYVHVAEDNSKPLETLIDEVYDSMFQLIEQSDKAVETGELTRQESYRQAVRPYWEELTRD